MEELPPYTKDAPEGDSPDERITTARVDTLNASAITRRSACATGTVRTHGEVAEAPVRSAVSVTATPPPPGAAEPAGGAETVDEGLREPLRVLVREGVCVSDAVTEGVPDGLWVTAPVELGVIEALGVAVLLGERVCVALGVSVALCVLLIVADGVTVPDPVALPLGVALVLALPLMLRVPLSLGLALPLRVLDTLPDDVFDGLRDCVRVGLTLRDPELLRVDVREGVIVAVLSCDRVEACVPLRLEVRLRVCDCEALCDRVADGDGLELRVADALSVSLRVPDADAVPLAVPLPLKLLVDERVLACVGLSDAAPLRLCVDDCVSEKLAVNAWVPVPVALRERVTERVPVRLGVLEPLGLGLVLGLDEHASFEA